MDEPEIRWMRSTLDDDARAAALAVLSVVERERHGATVASRRDSFLAGRLLLRHLVAELSGDSPTDVALSALCPDCGGPHGAPHVEGYTVSLARADDIVVAAAFQDASIGIDIESHTQSDERLGAIAALTGHRDIRHWTRVEAVLKADGRGLRVDPRHVLVTADTATVDDAAYALREIDLVLGYCVTVAIKQSAAIKQN